MMRTVAVILVLASSGLGGCFVEERRHPVYVEPPRRDHERREERREEHREERREEHRD